MGGKTNDALEEQFKGLRELIDSKFSENREDHLRIEEQTKKTNGRVSSLEDETVKDAIWRAEKNAEIKMIKWAVTAIVIPVLSYAGVLLVQYIQSKI